MPVPMVGVTRGVSRLTNLYMGVVKARADNYAFGTLSMVSSEGVPMSEMWGQRRRATRSSQFLTRLGLAAVAAICACWLLAPAGALAAGAPAVTGVAPASGPMTGGTSVTISGSGFSGATAVMFGTQASPSYTVNSDGSITATAPQDVAALYHSNSLAYSAPVDVTVNTPNGTSATASADQFTYNWVLTVTNGTQRKTYSLAELEAVAPAYDGFGGISKNDQGTTSTPWAEYGYHGIKVADLLADTGGLANGAAVHFGAADNYGAGPGGVYSYNYVTSPYQYVTIFNPVTGSPDSITQFANMSTVLIYGTYGEFYPNSNLSSSWTALDSSSGPKVGFLTPSQSPLQVTTGNQWPKFLTSVQTAPAAPTVTGVSTPSGSVNGGTAVTITGTNVGAVYAVYFGNVAATGFVVNSQTQVTAVAPAQAAGPVDISVVTPMGTSNTSSADQFTYQTDIAGATIAAIPNQPYTGAAITPALTVTSNGSTLNAGTDYTVVYSNNTNVGTATATVTGIGNYTGTASASFTIAPATISLANIGLIPNQPYTGAAITPALTVTYNGSTLNAGGDYAVAYANNTAPGTATATVTGIGNYTGTNSASFTIVAATPSVGTWPSASAILVGQPLSASTLSGGVASVPGSFAFTNPGTTPGSTGTYSAAVTFTATDTTDFTTVSGTVNVTVNTASVVLSVDHAGTAAKSYTLPQLEALTSFSGYAGTHTGGGTKGPDAVTSVPITAIVQDALGTALTTSESVTVADYNTGSPYEQTFTDNQQVNFVGFSFYNATSGSSVPLSSLAGPLSSVLVYSDPQGRVMPTSNGPLRFFVADQNQADNVVMAGNPSVSNVDTLVVSEPAKTIAASAGNNQKAAIGTAVATRPSVLVTDAGGNPVSGVSVTFAVASGGGLASGAAATTNTSGIATVGSWTLGAVPGANTLTATVSGLSGSPVTFTATATADIAGATIAAIPNQPYTGAAITPALTVTYNGSTLNAGGDYAVAYANNTAPGTATATVTGIGSYTGTNSASFTIVAAQPPNISAGGPSQSAWEKSDVIVALTATSPDPAGVASITYTIDGGSQTTANGSGASSFTTDVTVPGPADGTNDGTHTISYSATGGDGHSSQPQTYTVNIDTQAPETTCWDAPTDWQSSTPVTVHLAADDYSNGSGVAVTYYEIDTGGPQTYSNSSGIKVSSDGQHSVAFWSVDNAGNAEAPTTIPVDVDTQAPVVSVVAPLDQGIYAQSGADKVAWTSTDSVSGVMSEVATVDGVAVKQGDSVGALGLGTHTFELAVTDNAGNQTIISNTFDVVAGATAGPTTSDDAPADPQNNPVTVHLTADDTGGPGVDYTEYRTELNNSSWSAWTKGTSVPIAAPANHTNDGSHVIQYDSVDSLGIQGAMGSCTVVIDTVDPTVSGVTPADGAAVTLADTSTAIAWTASDTNGVDSAEATVDGASVAATVDNSGDWAGPALSSFGLGHHVFQLTVIDNAGNQTVVTNGFDVYAVDNVAPTTTDDAPADWQNQPVTVHFSATDNLGGSGIASTLYSTDGGKDFTNGTSVTVDAPAGHSNDGVHTIWYYSVDNVGNKETPHSCTVMIDTTAPQVVGVVPADGKNYVMNSGATVNWAASDPNGSGVAADSVVATIDDQPVSIGDSLDAAGPGAHAFVLHVSDAAGNETVVSSAFTNVSETIAVALPKTASTWQSGTSQTVRFAVKFPLGVGQFGIWLTDSNNTAYPLLKTIAPVDGVSLYTVVVPANVSAGTYQVVVGWRTDSGAGWAVQGKSAPFSVAPAQAVTVTSPFGGAIWQVGTRQTIAWTLGNPVADGSFTVWVHGNHHWTAIASGLAAKAGVTSYKTKWTVRAAVANGYLIVVRWTSKDGTQTLTGTSPAFEIASATALHITSPSSHVTWKRGKNYTVKWRLSDGVAGGGVYGVWIVSASGRSWNLTPSGVATTSATVRINVPAHGGYRIVVRWEGSSAGPWTLSGRSALITIQR